jgi:hypothetical protein
LLFCVIKTGGFVNGSIMKMEFDWYRPGFSLALVIAMLLALSSFALVADVYTWTDENGIVHYGAIPPDEGDAEQVDLDEPAPPGGAGAPADADESGRDTENTASFAQQQRDKLSQQREFQQASQAEVDRLCQLHRARKEKFEPAQRILWTNEQGETVRMDNEERAALVEESKEFIARNCQ